MKINPLTTTLLAAIMYLLTSQVTQAASGDLHIADAAHPRRLSISSADNSSATVDTDGDGVWDYEDNCPFIANPAQTDSDLADGAIDHSFGGTIIPAGGFIIHNNAAGGNGHDSGQAIVLDRRGRIYITGNSSNADGNTDMVIWRYKKSGKLDTSFGAGKGFITHNSAAGGNADDYGQAIVLGPSGNIYVTGYSYNLAGNADMVIWRYKKSGRLDTRFGNGKGEKRGTFLTY